MRVNGVSSPVVRTDRVNTDMHRPENSVELAAVPKIEALGLTAIKLQKVGRRGWPDRLILGPQKTVFFMEFKRIDETLRPLQIFVRSIIESFGLSVYECKTVKEALDACEKEIKAAKNRAT